MIKIDAPAHRDSPARRLGSLYLATLSTVALLSVVCQGLILQELVRLGTRLKPISLALRQQSADRSLGLAASALVAARDNGERDRQLGTLREALAVWERETSVASSAPANAGSTDARKGAADAGDPSRRAVVRAAERLIGSPGGAEAPGRLRELLEAEQVFAWSTVAAAHQTEAEIFARITRLKSTEVNLFALMVLVLVLESLFVISPAVRKIRQFMAEMERSNEALKSYAQRLERSNHELQDFASVASHDLQEPLRKVQAFSDRLRTKCGAALDDQGRDYLDRIQNAARRMQTLINDLLTYARVTTKAQPFVPTDLTSATREVVADLEIRAEQVNGKVEVGALPTVEADPLQVRQLMQNLIGNALKYHRADVPPVVKVYSRSPQSNGHLIPYDLNESHCEIVVEDNGIGFEEIYAERIFTIFQRLHGRNEYEGTGVGLAVCRKIVERHGGTITARSTPGKGSTFLVTLPVRQPKEGSPDGEN